MKCNWCGKEFEGEEVDAPMSYRGDTICDNCHNEKSFPCAICEEYMTDEDVRHFAVNDDDDGDFGAEKGIYEIISRPFFSDNMFTQTIHGGAVKKIAEPGDESGSGYVCNDCSKKLEDTDPNKQNCSETILIKKYNY